jgi:hypothetical protein
MPGKCHVPGDEESVGLEEGKLMSFLERREAFDKYNKGMNIFVAGRCDDANETMASSVKNAEYKMRGSLKTSGTWKAICSGVGRRDPFIEKKVRTLCV